MRRELRSWTRDLAVALGLAIVIMIFLYQPVKVEGTSMNPLLSDQERIFINKFVYRFEPIERGDVVVFWYPLDRSKSFIKRVVGLPGETIEIRVGPSLRERQGTAGSVCSGRLSRRFELSRRGGFPQDEYFVMGDHRDSSNDSRVFGPVPRQYIYGKAVFAYWPVDHFGSLDFIFNRQRGIEMTSSGGHTERRPSQVARHSRSRTEEFLTAARRALAPAVAAKSFLTPASPATRKFSPIPAIPGRSCA